VFTNFLDEDYIRQTIASGAETKQTYIDRALRPSLQRLRQGQRNWTSGNGANDLARCVRLFDRWNKTCGELILTKADMDDVNNPGAKLLNWGPQTRPWLERVGPFIKNVTFERKSFQLHPLFFA